MGRGQRVATKYVCDRCGAEVPSKDDFYICEVYPACRKDRAKHAELCGDCAEEIEFFFLSTQDAEKGGAE